MNVPQAEILEPVVTITNGQQTALVPLSEAMPPCRSVATFADVTGGEAAFWTSLDQRDPKNKALILRAMQQSDRKAIDALNVAFPLSNLLVHPVEIADQNSGEIVEHFRIVLVSADNETVACISEGIYRSCRTLMQLYGKPPWTPPLNVAIRPIKTRLGRTTYILDVVPDVPAANAMRKGK